MRLVLGRRGALEQEGEAGEVAGLRAVPLVLGGQGVLGVTFRCLVVGAAGGVGCAHIGELRFGHASAFARSMTNHSK